MINWLGNDHYAWEELKIHQSEAMEKSCAQVLFFLKKKKKTLTILKNSNIFP